MSKPERHGQLKRIQWIKVLTFFSVLIAGLVALLAIDNLLLSFVLAIMISYIISPLVDYLEGTGVGRIIAIVVVYCFTISLVGLAVWSMTPFLMTQLASLKGRIPDYVEGTVKLFNDFTQ